MPTLLNSACIRNSLVPRKSRTGDKQKRLDRFIDDVFGKNSRKQSDFKRQINIANNTRNYSIYGFNQRQQLQMFG